MDWLGAALLSLGLAAVLLGVSQAGAWGWGSPANLGSILGGVRRSSRVFVAVEAHVHAAVDRPRGAAQAAPSRRRT